MDNDDKQVGQILNRRDVLKILGIGSAATILAACTPAVTEILSPTAIPATQTPLPVTPTLLQETATSVNIPACVVRPELTEGPYFVDEMLNRSDIRSDASDGVISQGAPLDITFNVSQVSSSGCTSLASAQVDIWHCDAAGVYSDVQGPGSDSIGKKFLRGYQLTDTNGIAKFTTIYPGWYQGRAVHIHFKMRVNNYEFTSQLFFDDTLSDQVYLQEPYASRGIRSMLNNNDNIFSSELVLPVNPSSSGYTATF